MIGKEYQGKKIVGIFSATNHELDGYLKNHSLLKVDGQNQNLVERNKSFLNGEFLFGYVYVSKDCEEEQTNVVNGFVSFLYEIKGNIKEDMDFLNDIDKESLTDAHQLYRFCQIGRQSGTLAHAEAIRPCVAVVDAKA